MGTSWQADPGLCGSCAHARAIASARGSTFLRCDLSFTDSRYPRYPALPVVACEGYRQRGHSSPRDVDRSD